MAFLDDFRDSNEFVTAAFYNKTVTFTNGIATETWASTPTLSASVLMWTGTAADRVVSEKLRAEVDGVIAMDYQDYTTTINENAKVVINSVEYSVIYIDNVANQNELIQIPVKKK